MTLKNNQRFRFTALNSITKVPVTRAQLLNLLTMAVTTTSQYRLYDAILLKSVQIWSVPPSTAIAQQVATVEWTGINAPSIIVSDTSMGNARPLHVFTTPPPNSSDRWWSISGSNENEVLFYITAPQYAVVDVVIQMRLQDDDGAVAGQNGTGAASTVGVIYCNYLDGFTNKELQPTMGNPTLP